MKPTALLFILLGVIIGGGGAWLIKRGASAAPAKATEAKPVEEEAAGPRVTRDAHGNAVIALSDEARGKIGIQGTNPSPMQMSPELKGYGRVLDPAPLAALLLELASAQAAYGASSNELARLNTLAGQGNASTRVLQTAEAAAARDQLAIQSAKDRLALSWGKAVADLPDLPALVQSLVALEAALVRIDLPVGETLKQPAGARLASPSGEAAEAEFLGPAPGVEPQMQGRGFLFQVRPNPARLSPGQAVVGHLKLPGEPLGGVVIPRDAVVRTEGAGWVYVSDRASGESFTRTEIALDHPTDAGWFVTKGVTASDRVVVAGAQQLLAIELKSAAGE